MSDRPVPMTIDQFMPVFRYLYDNVAPFEKGSDEEIERRFQNRFKAHWQALKNYTLASYQRGVNYYLASESTQSFPRPADILNAINDSYEPPTFRADPRADPDAEPSGTLDMDAELKKLFSDAESEHSVKSDRSDESDNE